MKGLTENYQYGHNVLPSDYPHMGLQIQENPSFTDMKPGSVCSSMTIKTWRSLHTRQEPRTRVLDDRNVRSSVSSRGRPIRNYEGDAFLKIDLVPGNSQSSRKVELNATGFSFKGGSRPSSQGYSMIGGQSSRQSSSGFSTLTNGRSSPHSGSQGAEIINNYFRKVIRPDTLATFVTLQTPPNIRVKMPFKQATNQPDSQTLQQITINPGQALIESTTHAIDFMSQIFQIDRPTSAVQRRGRLRTARLRSLDPVTMNGPAIEHCLGIVSETRANSSSSTYQRLKPSLSRTQVIPAYIQKSCRNPLSLCESIHRTSEVCSPESTPYVICSQKNVLN